MKQQKPTTGQVLAEEAFALNEWILGAVEKFPRSQKFLLGDRIQTAALDLLLALVEATYTHDRAALLRSAQLHIEKMRFLFRLANRAGIVSLKSYEHAVRTLDEIGRGVGGWRKANDAQAVRRSLSADRELRGVAPGRNAGDQG